MFGNMVRAQGNLAKTITIIIEVERARGRPKMQWLDDVIRNVQD